MSTIQKILGALPFNGNKTAIGGAIFTLAVSFGLLTQGDVDQIRLGLPVIAAGFGALMQLVGIAHKAIKRLRG